jgi:hypothetical protein
MQPIVLKKVKFELNFIPGSKESINFHKALSTTKATKIFRTEAIKKIL